MLIKIEFSTGSYLTLASDASVEQAMNTFSMLLDSDDHFLRYTAADNRHYLVNKRCINSIEFGCDRSKENHFRRTSRPPEASV